MIAAKGRPKQARVPHGGNREAEGAPVSMLAAAPAHGERHLPGELGLWMFICGDLLMFTLLFSVFLRARAAAPAMFAESQQHLSTALGLTNVLVLLTGSWLAARALLALRAGRNVPAARMLGGAILSGLVFAVIKVIEYSTKIVEGHTFFENDFFMYYFIITGIHFVHLMTGVASLVYLRHRAPGFKAGQESFLLYEGVAVFWHLVDLLWVIIFPLVYLLQ